MATMPPVKGAFGVGDQDNQLIGRCLAGDAAAFEALHAAHAGRVHGYLLRSGFDESDADDLGQEAFLRAFKSLRTFNARKGAFSHWLGAIARNVARRHWEKRRLAENFDPDLAEEMLAAPDSPGQSPEVREESAAVAACVEALPPELARLVRLRYVEGRTTRGLAQAVSLPEATVRLRLAETMALLERCLKGKGILE